MLRNIRASPSTSPSGPPPTPLRRPTVFIAMNESPSRNGGQLAERISAPDIGDFNLPMASTSGQFKREPDSPKEAFSIEESRHMQVDGKGVVFRSEEVHQAVVQQVPGRGRANPSRKKTMLEVRDPLTAKKVIDALTARVVRLERRERVLLGDLTIKRELIKDIKAEAEGAQTALILAEEAISQQEAALEESRLQLDRYQRWWLTENRCLKVILERVPACSEREDLQHFISSSQARYAVYSAGAL